MRLMSDARRQGERGEAFGSATLDEERRGEETRKDRVSRRDWDWDGMGWGGAGGIRAIGGAN